MRKNRNKAGSHKQALDPLDVAQELLGMLGLSREDVAKTDQPLKELFPAEDLEQHCGDLRYHLEIEVDANTPLIDIARAWMTKHGHPEIRVPLKALHVKF